MSLKTIFFFLDGECSAMLGLEGNEEDEWDLWELEEMMKDLTLNFLSIERRRKTLKPRN